MRSLLLCCFVLVFALFICNNVSANDSTTVETLTTDEIDSISTTLTASNADENKDEDDHEKVEIKSEAIKEENNNADNDDEEEEDEDDEDDSTGQCDATFANFLRNINGSAFLPDDYHEISENIKHEELHNPVQDMNSTLDKIDRLIKYREKLVNNKDLKNSIQYFGSIVSDKIFEAKLSPQCSADLLRVMSAARNFELWALKIPDSWANTMPSGLLSGHISTFGEFDQCIQVKSPPIPQEEGVPPRHIYGRYCQVQLKIQLPELSLYKPEWENSKIMNMTISSIAENIIKSNNLAPFQISYVKALMQLVKALKSNIAHYGVCFPNACSTDDIERLFNSIFYPITKLPVIVPKELCTDHQELRVVTLDGQQWFAVYLLSFLTITVFGCTIYHLYLRHIADPRNKQILPSFNENIVNKSINYNNNNNEVELKENGNLNSQLSPATEKSDSNQIPENLIKRSLTQQFVLAFSFVENAEKLFRPEKRFAVLDTLRFGLTLGVYSVQAFNFSMMFTVQMLRNIVDTVPGQLLNQDRYWFARTAGMWIDGFVFALGLTMIISQSSKLKRSNGEFSFFAYMFKRWFRLSAAMLGTFVILYLYPLVGDGPLWFINDRWILTPCKKTSSIISSFLYYSNWNPALNNYQPSDHFPICNPPTWFLSASTQIYIFLPLVFVPLYRYPRMGMTILLSLLAISPIFTTSPTWALGHATYLDLPDVQDVAANLRKFLNYHVNPLQYVTPVCIGMLTGWLIKFRPNFQFIGGRRVEILLWFCSALGIYGSFATNTFFWNIHYERPRWMALAWFALSKFVWPGSLAYITFMCSTGRAKTMNEILSVRTLQPIAKLSYSIYLLRVPVIFYRYTSVRYTYGLHYWQAWQNIAIDYTITAILAFGLYILFEAPSIAILKIFDSDQLWQYFDRTKQIQSISSNGNQQNKPNVPVKIILPNETTVESDTKEQDTEQPQTQFYVYNGGESQRL